MRLPRQLLGAPAVGNTLEAVTLRNTDSVNDLVLLEDAVDVDGLLEEALRELDLVRDAAAVDLDLHQVRLLLTETSLANLGVREHTHDSAVLADTLELALNRLAAVL